MNPMRHIEESKKKISPKKEKTIKIFDKTQSEMTRAMKRNEKFQTFQKNKFSSKKTNKRSLNQLAQMPRYRPITRQMLAKFNAEN